jgi:hypothetical protein
MTELGAYRRWWPWLSRFEGEAFAAGEAWRCAVRPPLPYVLRFTIRLDEIDPCRSAAATVDGDIVGTASLTLQPLDDGAATEVRLVSQLAPANPVLRQVARLAAPVVRMGHDWVLDTGAAQFRRQALG